MADITEAEQWDTGVYQLETTDPVQGGVDGVDNIPHKALANRTVWLKAQVALKALLGGSATQLFKVKAAVANDEAVNKLQMENAIAAAMFIGEIKTFPTSIVPDGLLECNGAELSRTAYAALFALLGTVYGAGDGSTTFNIPDLRGEFIRGFDNGRGIDVGRDIATLQLDDMRSHNHAIGGYNGASYTSQIRLNSDAAGTARSVFTKAFGGSETRPRNIAMMFCIKY
jgi:microcystin-dependent protein